MLSRNAAPINRIASKTAQFALFVLGALILTGCETCEEYSLTHKLWNNGELRKFSEPAPDPKLALARAGGDVLVEYDALSEKHSVVKRRAYYLQANQERVLAGQAPKFLEPLPAEGLTPIQVFDSQTAVPDPPPLLAGYAVISKEGRAFTLYWPATPAEGYELPVYLETQGTAVKVALTPFAVAGDTVMVSLVVGVVGFIVWVQSGAPTCH